MSRSITPLIPAMIIVALFLAVGCQSQPKDIEITQSAPVKISSEALLAPDNQMLWGAAINRAPGDKVLADVNPPRFRWAYVPNMREVMLADPGPRDLQVLYNFRFQIADEPTFKKPIVNVDTEFNCYNELAPLPEGKTYYWRIGYMCQVFAPNGVADAATAQIKLETEPGEWSVVRSFDIAAGTPKWDRSALKNPKFGPHPRMPFAKDQIETLRELIKNDPQTKAIFKESIALPAEEILEHPQWNNWPETDTDDRVSKYFFVGRNLMQAAMVYKITGDPKYKNAVDIFATIATYPPGGRSSPEGMGGDKSEDSTSLTEYLALAYEWFYDDYTPAQRKAFEDSLQWRLDKWMNEYQWGGTYYNMVETDHYTGPIANMSSMLISGGGHSWEGTMASLPAAISLYEKSEIARRFFHITVNYLIGIGEINSQFGGYNLGCSYGQSHLKWMLYQTMYVNAALPELQIFKNPYYKQVGEYFTALVPIGLPSAPWGRIDSQGSGVSHRKEVFRLLAYITGDPILLQNWMNAGGSDYFNWRAWVHVAAPLHFSGTLEPQTGTQTRYMFPLTGYAMAHKFPPTDPKAFTDGAGVIFRCYPAPSAGGAVYYNESAFQFYAYGELINFGGGTGGAEPHGFHTMSHNTILVDGIGQAPVGRDRWDIGYRGVMMAESKGDDYVYWMGDATMCYPRTPARVSSWVVKFDPEVYGKLAVPNLKRFRRHILFVRDKYVLVFDDLATEKGKPSKFNWLWHVLQKGEAKYDAKLGRVEYPAGDVNVILQHISRPGEIEYQNYQDLEGLVNPVTGEDFRKNKHTAKELEDPRWSKFVPQHNMWFTNKEPAEQFNFFTVIYPVTPGEKAPAITRLDDLTVKIQDADGTDIVSFDPETTHPATIVVDLPAMRGPTGL